MKITELYVPRSSCWPVKLCNDRKSRQRGMLFWGVLIVCSLSVFYVTTTHSFSFTYGWIPRICFLSLFLMTWVTSLTLHMPRRHGPTTQGFWFQSRWVINLNFQKVSDDNALIGLRKNNICYGFNVWKGNNFRGHRKINFTYMVIYMLSLVLF